MLRRLFILLLLISISFSLDCSVNVYQSFIPEIQSFMGVVILLNVAIITLAYMYGTSFRDTNALVYSKDELFHLFLSVMLIIALIGIASFSCVFGEFFKQILFDGSNPDFYTPDMSVSDVAKNYLRLVKADAISMFSGFTQSSISNEMFSTWVYTIYTFSGDTVSTGTDAYKKTFSLQYDSLNSIFITPIIVSVSLQELIVDFLLDFAIPVIFPLGLLLRIFGPTRSMGNLVIAFSIGVFVLLPIMYAFNASMYVKTLTPADCAEYSAAVDDIILGDCSTKGNFFDVGRMIPQAFFLPNLTLAIFITFISAVNKALRVIT